jgi:hypothetical protein
MTLLVVGGNAIIQLVGLGDGRTLSLVDRPTSERCAAPSFHLNIPLTLDYLFCLFRLKTQEAEPPIFVRYCLFVHEMAAQIAPISAIRTSCVNCGITPVKLSPLVEFSSTEALPCFFCDSRLAVWSCRVLRHKNLGEFCRIGWRLAVEEVGGLPKPVNSGVAV